MAAAQLLHVLPEDGAQVVKLPVGREIVDINHIEVLRAVIRHDDIEAEQRQLQLFTKTLADRTHSCENLFLHPSADSLILRSAVVDMRVEILASGVVLLSVEVHLLSISSREVRQRASLRHVDDVAQHVALEEAARVVDELL